MIVYFFLQLIDAVFYKFRPFQRCFGLVEGLPGYGLSKSHLKGLVDILIHFVDQEKHGQIKFQMLVAEVGQAVEKVTVLTAKMDRHHITLVLYAFRDKSLRPWHIVNLTVNLARTDAGRIHQHVVVALKPCFNHSREVTALLSSLVDRDAKWSQTRQVHQEIIDQIPETAVIMAADNTAQCYAVSTAQRMVAHKSIEAAIVL